MNHPSRPKSSRYDDFDVILGMDWLAENLAGIDYHKKVVFTPPNRLTFKFKGICTGTTKI